MVVLDCVDGVDFALAEAADESVVEFEYHLGCSSLIRRLGRREALERTVCEEIIRAERSVMEGANRLDAAAAYTVQG